MQVGDVVGDYGAVVVTVMAMAYDGGDNDIMIVMVERTELVVVLVMMADGAVIEALMVVIKLVSRENESIF